MDLSYWAGRLKSAVEFKLRIPAVKKASINRDMRDKITDSGITLPKEPAMKTEVMLFVTDVETSSLWYQSLLGAKSGHGGPEYEMILSPDGTLLFQLHRLEADEHGIDLSDQSIPRGAGILLYVQVEDVNQVFQQAKSMDATIESDPVFIKLAGHTECIIKDPDGYSLAIYSR